MVARAVLAGGMPYRDAWDFKPPGVFLVYAATRAHPRVGPGRHPRRRGGGPRGMIAAMMRLTGDWWGDSPHRPPRRRRRGAGARRSSTSGTPPSPSRSGAWSPSSRSPLLGPVMDERTPLRRGAERDGAPARALGRALRLRRACSSRRSRAAARWSRAALGLRILREQGASRARVPLRAALRPAMPHPRRRRRPLRALPRLVRGPRRAAASSTTCSSSSRRTTPSSRWVGRDADAACSTGASPSGSATTAASPPWACCSASASRARRASASACGCSARIIAVHVVGVVMQGEVLPLPLRRHLAAHRAARRARLPPGVGAPRARAGRSASPAFFALVVFGRALPHRHQGPGGHLPPALRRAPRRLHPLARATTQALDRLASVADVNAVANREVAAFLRARVPADRAVFVWGFEPVIYDLADRAPATRYLYDVPQRVAWAKDARARPPHGATSRPARPAAIVVEHRDVFPMVTGDAIDSADTLRELPRARRAHRRPLRARRHHRRLRRVPGADHEPAGTPRVSSAGECASPSSPPRSSASRPRGTAAPSSSATTLAEELHARGARRHPVRHRRLARPPCRSAGSTARPEWPPHPHDEMNHVAWAARRDGRAAASTSRTSTARSACPFRRFARRAGGLHHPPPPGRRHLAPLRGAPARRRYVAISRRQLELEVELPDATVIHHGALARIATRRAIATRATCSTSAATRPRRARTSPSTRRAIAGLPHQARGPRPPAGRRLFRGRGGPAPGRGAASRSWARPGTPRKLALLRGARALLCPLQWEEPFGLVAVEAMLCGAPVLGFPRGSFPEIVDEGVTGFLAPPDDVEALGRLAADSPASIARACAQRARARFSTAVMAGAYEALYARVRARAGAPLTAPAPSRRSSAGT